MKYELYIAAIIAIIIIGILMKKVASCLFRILAAIVLLVILAYALHTLGYI